MYCPEEADHIANDEIKTDYISRWRAQDAMTDENLIRNLDQVENGDAKRYARAAIRVLEQLEPADVRPVVLCKDCIHAPEPGGDDYGLDVRFPDDDCPFNCPDHWYNVRPAPEFFCAKGDRREEDEHGKADIHPSGTGDSVQGQGG